MSFPDPVFAIGYVGILETLRRRCVDSDPLKCASDVDHFRVDPVGAFLYEGVRGRPEFHLGRTDHIEIRGIFRADSCLHHIIDDIQPHEHLLKQCNVVFPKCG